MMLHLASVSLYLAHMLLVLTAVYRRSHLNRGGDKTQYGVLGGHWSSAQLPVSHSLAGKHATCSCGVKQGEAISTRSSFTLRHLVLTHRF